MMVGHAAQLQPGLELELEGLARATGALGLALVRPAGSLICGELAFEHDAIASQLGALFGRSQPRAKHIELEFDSGYVVLMAVSAGVLVARFGADAPARSGLFTPLVGELEAALEQVSLGASELDTGEDPGLRQRLAKHEAELAARELSSSARATLERLIALCRRGFGPLVIRNYLRETQRVLEHDFPSLRRIEITLAAELVVEDPPPEGFVRALGAWCFALRRRAAQVSPRVADVDLRALAGPASVPLEAAGFFEEIQQ